MVFARFLGELFQEGHVLVDHPNPASIEIESDDRDSASRLLAERERFIRQGFPGPAPSLDPSAAMWGATTMYRACQAAVFRDLSADDLDRFFPQKCPGQLTAASHYSVDLALAFLPDLARFTTTAAADDPLCIHLRRIGADWPLSSVGMKLDKVPSVEALQSSENLFKYYVDRVIAKADASRRSDPRVESAVAAVFGAHAVALSSSSSSSAD